MNVQPTPSQSPIVVDMDGALVKTDMLVEGIAQALFQRPLALLAALPSMLKGRAAFKEAIAAIAYVDPRQVPVREELVTYLRAAREAGRPIYLYTAGDHSVAEAVAGRLQLFDGARGSRTGHNMKGPKKLAAIQADIGFHFTYAGDSHADLPVWRAASGIILSGAPGNVARKARLLPAPIEAEFPPEPAGIAAWVQALRLHQWSKNLLIFVPLILAHTYGDLRAILACLAGFLLLGLGASGTYILNDLSDITADRMHRTKRERPFAAGRLPVIQGLIVAPLLILGALAGGLALSPGFGGLLFLYFVLTLGYSFGLKRVAMLDVALLGALYTIRLMMGTVLAGGAVSPWLLVFASFFFFSLSLAKRHVELIKAAEMPPGSVIPGRGYLSSDWPLTLAIGTASCAAAILVLVLYLVNDAMPQGAYSASHYLWAAPVLVALWTLRVWLFAHRGDLHDDPVAFAIKDRVSLALGAILAVFFTLAVVA
ncbi:MAG: UbiA family prenyltransferase [Alphaproteobacteria bacterium]|nr:UbiA family prenyltransferase [Alphaproteobacteria bacterium]